MLRSARTVPTRLALMAIVLAALVLTGCVGTRSDFPSWRFKEPALVSNQATSGQEDMPDVAVDRAGNAVVVWSDKPSGDDAELYWRRYDAIGQPLTPAVRITNNAFSDYYPRIAYVLGTTYVVWMGDELTSSNIYWVALDNAGNIIAGPTMISDPAQNDYDPRIYYCGESHVIWNGDTASTGFAIYYAKIADDGTADLPYRTISASVGDEEDGVGAISADCSILHVAYRTYVTIGNGDVAYTAVNTGTGTNLVTVQVEASPLNQEQPAIAVANDATGTTRQVNIVWRQDDGAGGEIKYASRNPSGAACSPSVALTNDSVVDQAPAIVSISYSSNSYAYVAWESFASGSTLDIYGSLFLDNCSPTPPAATLVSNGAVPLSQADRYVQVIGSRAPDGAPIFATVWRGEASGRVFARFSALSSLAGLIGNSEDISSPSSAGLPPSPYLVTPELAVGGPSDYARHLRVVWLGYAGSLTDVYFQQTAWQSDSPIFVSNHTGDAPAPGKGETRPQAPAYP